MSTTNRRINFDYDNPLNCETSQQGSPERNLLMSMLERAILDYVGNETKDIESATEWLFGEEQGDADSVFSFRWICRELDLDPAFVSRTIKAMPRRGNKRTAPWYFTKISSTK